ncbi:GNAT family N-acetyltransferase [Rubellicoccus peritrichatus]|uniref:GNAT family N-acetyltransferase n=1 Tax=Rubellicoccus peritrichatus TaxID=3080537 RepID=A0AAQ3LEC3_9BACT|nr:GNAT family N-acetyltransferase [Puniceicoccus sp. CR14]WOO43117.1 GNAT family N-acetyltransferase [Puniceicoccus sp. CR14]
MKKFFLEDVSIDVAWDDRQGCDFQAMWMGRKVGHALCIIDGDRIKLCDIVVFDGVKFKRAFGLLPYRHVNFRNRGIGSLLMKAVISEIRKHQISKIYGFIVSKDLKRNPNLLNWYVGWGFAEVDRDEFQDVYLRDEDIVITKNLTY